MKKSMREYILRHTAARERNLKYDFLPPLLEVIDKPAHPAGTFIIWAVFALIATAVVWSMAARLDVVVAAPGMAVPEGDVRVVQTVNGGIVESIAASDGDYVKAGDCLLTLSGDMAGIEIEKTEYGIGAVEVQRELYERLCRGEELSDIKPEDYPDYYWIVSGVLQEEQLYQNQLQILQEQTRQTMTAKERELQEDNYRIQRQLDLAEKMSACDTRLEEYRAESEQEQFGEDYNTIRSPEDGYVMNLQVNTPGQVLSAAQLVAGIVPEDAELIFRCYVRSRDIADIQAGQEAEIKFQAYPYSRYGAAKGIVSEISPSVSNLEGIGNVYTVKIIFDNHADPAIQYLSGMDGTAEIKADDRSVMEYFLDPIRNGFDSSLKEK